MMMTSLSSFFCLALAVAVPTTASTTASTTTRHGPTTTTGKRRPTTYLSCHVPDSQYSCDLGSSSDSSSSLSSHQNAMKICHYNGSEYVTLCMKSRSSIVPSLAEDDYCGPCQPITATTTTRSRHNNRDASSVSSRRQQKNATTLLVQPQSRSLGKMDMDQLTRFLNLTTTMENNDEQEQRHREALEDLSEEIECHGGICM